MDWACFCNKLLYKQWIKRVFEIYPQKFNCAVFLWRVSYVGLWVALLIFLAESWRWFWVSQISRRWLPRGIRTQPLSCLLGAMIQRLEQIQKAWEAKAPKGSIKWLNQPGATSPAETWGDINICLYIYIYMYRYLFKKKVRERERGINKSKNTYMINDGKSQDRGVWSGELGGFD